MPECMPAKLGKSECLGRRFYLFVQDRIPQNTDDQSQGRRTPTHSGCCSALVQQPNWGLQVLPDVVLGAVLLDRKRLLFHAPPYAVAPHPHAVTAIAAGPISVAVVERLRNISTTATRAPRLANSWAQARPIPEPTPVITATFSCSTSVLLFWIAGDHLETEITEPRA